MKFTVQPEHYNNWIDTERSELALVINQVGEVIEAAEQGFKADEFENIKDLTPEEISTKFNEYFTTYLDELHTELRQVNQDEPVADPSINKLSLLRLARTCTVISAIYQIDIDPRLYAMDRITLDTYEEIHRSMTAAIEASRKAAEESESTTTH